MDTNQEGKAQIVPALGGTISDSRATPSWGVPTLGNQRRNFPKCLEHRTTMEVLLMTISSLLCSNTFTLLQVPERQQRMMVGGQR
jgi:hypothetical protein